MIIYKRYIDEKAIHKTSTEKESINLAKTFINVKLIMDALKEGKPVYTHWAVYSRKKGDLK